jgi:hypothetical protein
MPIMSTIFNPLSSPSTPPLGQRPAHVPIDVVAPRVPDDAIMFLVAFLGYEAIGIGARVAVVAVRR